MQEKQKAHKEQAPTEGGFGGPFDGPSAPANQATLSSGQYLEKKPIGGMTVKAVREKYKSEFNIHDMSVSIINKKQVDDNTVVQAGQKLTFIHKSGEKGVNS